jgi:hypothetical protein
MDYRIITHTSCADGFCSAFVFKRYFADVLGFKPNSQEMKNVEVIGIHPGDVQNGVFKFKKTDIVLDLPLPKEEVFFWADHHLTSKPKESKPNYHWRVAKSCTGLLLDIASGKGLKITQDIQEFKEVINKIDNAEYSLDEVKQCFYLQESYDSPSALQKMIILRAMIHTKDNFLNQEILGTVLSSDLGTTPIDSAEMWKLNPMMYYKAELIGHHMWRNEIDKTIYFDKDSDCVVIDERKIKNVRGVSDRFYSSVKYPDSSYSVDMRIAETNLIKFSVNCNIFNKDFCSIDIGLLCYTVGKTFGDGSGGGHTTVGGTLVYADKADAALKFILGKLKESL